VELYQHCWAQDPNKRPTIGEVRNRLETLQLDEPYISETTPLPKKLPSNQAEESIRNVLEPQKLEAPNNINQHSTQAKISIGQFSASDQNPLTIDDEETVKLTKDGPF